MAVYVQTVAIFQRNDFKRVALFQHVRKVFQFAVHAGAYGVSRQPLGNRLRRLHAGSVFFRFQYVAVFQNDIHNEFSSVFSCFVNVYAVIPCSGQIKKRLEQCRVPPAFRKRKHTV